MGVPVQSFLKAASPAVRSHAITQLRTGDEVADNAWQAISSYSLPSRFDSIGSENCQGHLSVDFR
jgi:hypothetical protein